MSDTEWKFKEGAEPQGSSDGFWYDISAGGYIDPAKVLDDETQLTAVLSSISTLMDFEEALSDAELLNEF